MKTIVFIISFVPTFWSVEYSGSHKSGDTDFYDVLTYFERTCVHEYNSYIKESLLDKDK